MYNATLDEILLGQQEEKKSLLSLHYQERSSTTSFVTNLRQPIIKIIVGPRRSGKSTFALNALNTTTRGKFTYVNFDNRELITLKFTTNQLVKSLKNLKNRFIFLDEIQNLESFPLVVSSLQRNGFNLLISGSNSNLLSGELASHLTGRVLSLELLPFSLQELKSNIKLEEIINKGLFPEIVVNKIDAKLYLKELFNAVIFKDIVQRYKLRKSSDLIATAIYLVSNFATQQSFLSISRKLSISSLATVSRYISYLKESYLLLPISKFSFKTSEVIKNPRKYYPVDTGLVNAMSSSSSRNLGRLLENLVLLELLKLKFEREKIFYFISRKTAREVDFLLDFGSKNFVAIQVCVSLIDDQTKEREIRSFEDLENEIGKVKKFIVTYNKEIWRLSGISIITAKELNQALLVD